MPPPAHRGGPCPARHVPPPSSSATARAVHHRSGGTLPLGLTDGVGVWQAVSGCDVQNTGLAVAGDNAWVVSSAHRLVWVRLAAGRGQARSGTRWRSAAPPPPSSATRWSPGARTGWCTVSAPGQARVLSDRRVQRTERGLGLLDLRQVAGPADHRELACGKAATSACPYPGVTVRSLSPQDTSTGSPPGRRGRATRGRACTGRGEDAHGRHVGGPLAAAPAHSRGSTSRRSAS